MSDRPIGIFDSGVGGLSILKAIREHLPNENLVYFADSKYAPYGELDQDILKQRCLHIANFFVEHNAKAMVIACNTATALMAEWLRAEFNLPIIAIEPAIKPATEISKNGKIGVFATEHTLKSERYLNLVERYAAEKTVYNSSCQGFVEQVEKGEQANPSTLSLIEKYLKPMLEQKIDTLVLGCTHYPFLTDSIRTVAGDYPLTIVDNADAVSLQLTRVLAEQNIVNLSPHAGNQFFSSATDLKQHQKTVSNLLQTEIEVKRP